MTKEEILEKHFPCSTYRTVEKRPRILHEDKCPKCEREDDILAAMDEYAKEKAIAFNEWCAEGGWEKHIGENMWRNRMGYATEYTTEQLYTLFENHLKEKP